MKNSAYFLLSFFPEQSATNLRFPIEQKQTRLNKSYFLIKLPTTNEQFLIQEDSFLVEEQHFSIYEERSRHEQDKLSAYHYTLTLKEKEGNRLIIHVYFDNLGNYIDIHVKDELDEPYYLATDTTQNIVNLAKRLAMPLMSQMIHMGKEHTANLAKTYQKEHEDLLKLSQNIQKIEGKQLAALFKNKYKGTLESCIAILKKWNLLDDNRQIAVLALLNDIHQHIDSIEFEKPSATVNLTTIENRPNVTLNEEIQTPAPKSQIVKETVSVKQGDNLIKINQQISEKEKLQSKNVHGKLNNAVVLYRLYANKFKLEKDDTELLVVASKMNQCIDTINDLLPDFLVYQKASVFQKENLLTSALKINPRIEIPFESYYGIIEQGDTALLELLIHKFKPNLDHYGLNIDGYTLLLHALGQDKLEIAELLLRSGANPDMPSQRTGVTALYLAIAKKQYALLDLLLSYNANPNLKKVRPVIGYISNKNKSTGVFFLNIPQNDFLEKQGYTPVMCALVFSIWEAIEVFFKASHLPKIDFKLTANSQFTLLGIVASDRISLSLEKRRQLLTTLLEAGCAIDEPQGPGQCSSLYLACQFQQLDLVKLLVDLGADPNKEILVTALENGIAKQLPQTPFSIAIAKGDLEITQYLLEQTQNSITDETLAGGASTFMLVSENKPMNEPMKLLLEGAMSARATKRTNVPVAFKF